MAVGGTKEAVARAILRAIGERLIKER